MTASRARYLVAFTALLGAELCLWPSLAEAGDVTVDYSQLDSQTADAAVPLFAPVITTADLRTLKAPIHLHPLAQAMTSPTVKNLAAEVSRSDIHLHPPLPKMVTDITPLPADTHQAAAAPVTTIDLAMAALPPAPKTDTIPAEKTEIALDRAAIPPASKPAAPMIETVAAAPAVPPLPTKDIPDDQGSIMQVNAVMNKTDNLTPDDVVGLDFGTPPKTTNN